MIFKTALISLAALNMSCSLAAARTLHSSRLPAEPIYSFGLLDRYLTALEKQEKTFVEAEGSNRANAAQSMQRTLRAVERTAFRLQAFYLRRNERFGIRSFRILGRRASSARGALKAFEVARTQPARESALKGFDTRVLALVTQFQAISGGLNGLRCDLRQWTCCSPKRKRDLRSGESLACHWICVSKAQACDGFRGPRVSAHVE
jgi:hypothetical protein